MSRFLPRLLPLGAIAWREYASMFRTSLGWIALALFLCLSGYMFVSKSLIPGEAASMRPFFQVWWALLIVIAPLISMRLLSEEVRTGTVEPLLTAPIHEANIIVGKYLAGVLFLLTMLAPTLLYVALLEWASRPDYGPIIAGYLGIILLGMLYLAIGTLVSSLTSSQALAGLGTFFVLIGIDIGLTRFAAGASETLSRAIFAMSPQVRLADFAKGLINTGDVAFFVIASTWFLALATLGLESRRWR
jgi:ABC-2 type transport system permease protein